MHLMKNRYTDTGLTCVFVWKNGMNFDVFTIAALVDEFMDTLVGGRIQDVLDTVRNRSMPDGNLSPAYKAMPW